MRTVDCESLAAVNIAHTRRAWGTCSKDCSLGSASIEFATGNEIIFNAQEQPPFCICYISSQPISLMGYHCNLLLFLDLSFSFR